MKEKFKILLFLLLPLMAFGKKGDSEYKKTITKDYPNGTSAVLNISSKYGKIIIHSWKQSNIKATIVITGFGKNPTEAQNAANLVDVDESNTNGTISLQTSYHPFGGAGGKFFNWGSKGDSKDYVNVDYEVYVPEDLRKLVIENNFGDVITDVLSFPATIGMNYCTYDIKEVQKSLVLNMNYCDKGRIGKADALTVHCNYSSLKCDNVGSLTARSNYSDYELGTVGSLDIKSNYDEYKLGKTGAVNAKCNYSDFSIAELQAELNVKLMYGGVKAKSVASTFKGGNISLMYSDIKLQAISPRLGLQLKIDLKSGDLKNSGVAMRSESSIKKSNQLSYTAITSSGSEQSPVLDIDGTYSDVVISSN